MRLREQLRVAADLSSRLGGKRDPRRWPGLVVDELHETFAFYLAASSGSTTTACCGSSAGRGPLADVMAEFLIFDQPVSQRVNGRVARTGVTALLSDTREDPDYIVRDPKTDPRSELSVAIWVEDEVWGVLNIEEPEAGALGQPEAVLVETIAASLGSALHRSRLLAELEGAFTTTLAILTSTVEAKDDYTASHGEDVAGLAERVARRMALPDSRARDVRFAAMLHDVGKIAVPSEILLKRGPLTEEEWVLMRGHAAVGGDLVSRIAAFAHLAPAVRASHERWDGGGYPDGLAEREIPAGGSHHRRLRHLRRDHHRPSLPARPVLRRGLRGALQGRRLAARPRGRERAARGAAHRGSAEPPTALRRAGCTRPPPRAGPRRGPGRGSR